MVRKFLSLLVPVLAICLTILNASTSDAQTAPKEPSASHVNRGNSWIPNDDFQRAIKDYDIAIVFHPNSATAYYNRAVLLQANGQLESALSDYNKAIDLKPRYASAYTNRAGIYYAQGLLAEAMADSNRA
ncbi:MAG TPA: tetratricopeptide repeat protein, partial [Pyrinomonadaceae bacterium]|nr:tetratricopeptide repeat protein [Pyrinomonadaceae bacterium]